MMQNGHLIEEGTFKNSAFLTDLICGREFGSVFRHQIWSRLGVPGPAGIAVLARYAALCGVSACALMWSKHGVSIGKLFGTAGPDRFVERLNTELTPAHGQVS